MKPKKKKMRYRLLVGFLALISAALVYSNYVAFVVNRFYFPEKTKAYEIIWPVLFAVLFLALVIELFATRIYFTMQRQKEEPNQAPEPTAAAGRGSS